MAKALGNLAKGTVALVQGTPGYVAPRLKGFMFYARTEMAPPSPNEFGEIAVRFGKGLKTVSTFHWVNYSVKELWTKALVGIEVGCWLLNVLVKVNFVATALLVAQSYPTIKPHRQP